MRATGARARELDVLVVDDEGPVRESLSEALSGAGHRVAQASDGATALSLVATRFFDVAICDVQMPGMDGLTLCRKLRNEAPGTALVLMTSCADFTDVVAALRLGVVDYVTKPFDPRELVTHVIGPSVERHAKRGGWRRSAPSS
jgi:two-component system, OmpR family, response regulator ResD